METFICSADTSTLLCCEDVETQDEPDKNEEEFMKYLEKVRSTPPRPESSGEKSFEQFITRLDQMGIKIGEADDDNLEEDEEDIHQNVALNPKQGMFQKFLANLAKSGIKVELKQEEVTKGTAVSAKWSEGYTDSLANLYGAKIEVSYTRPEIKIKHEQKGTDAGIRVQQYKTTHFSASARISKLQGYQVFLRKRAGSSFGQKRAICIVQGKTDRILFFGSIKCFPLSFNTFETL
jgi:hypothetical protein